MRELLAVGIGGFLGAVARYLGDRWHGAPLHEAIVRRAREEGLAGATVLRGLASSGR